MKKFSQIWQEKYLHIGATPNGAEQEYYRKVARRRGCRPLNVDKEAARIAADELNNLNDPHF